MADPTFMISNKYVLGLGQWLNGLSLSGRESRERTKFIEALDVQLKEIDAMRLEFVHKYAEKDEEGEYKKVTDETGEHFVVPDESIDTFNKELKEYLDESSFILGGPGNVQRLKIIKDIVLDTTEKIAPSIAGEYSKWCDAFEAVEV